MEVAIAIIILLSTIMGILWEVFYYNGIQIITRFSSEEVPHSGELRSTLHNCLNDICAAYEKFNFFFFGIGIRSLVNVVGISVYYTHMKFEKEIVLNIH